MPKTKKAKYTYALGRRKEASARVRLFKGKGESLVNGVPIADYFSGLVNESFWRKPFSLTETAEKYFVSIKVKGGGIKGQVEASAHGIARALEKLNPEKFRPILKKAGLLARDPRVKERRKVGTGGKARRKKQSPKR
jgi:small subunit ribosomal protein S9